MQPSYLQLYKSGKLQKISEQVHSMLSSCRLCPRSCKVNRLNNENGYCRTGLKAKVYSYMPHHGEEPPISGHLGSGAIFFADCNMSCVYCQNYEFSQQGKGREVDDYELAQIMLELEGMGCHNINLVTPTHIMPQIIQALVIAASKGLKIPLVYNTGGYELPEIIKLLEGIVDIYLADMRYGDGAMSKLYSESPDYPEYNPWAIKEMHSQVGIANFDDSGIISKGLIIRHLVLPNDIGGTEKIMQFIAKEISLDSYISLMSQYTPYHKAKELKNLKRCINFQEFKRAQDIMDKYGLHNGWTQESGGLKRFAGVNIKPR